MVLMLAVVTEYASAASLTHELGTDVTVAWYSDQAKENPITIVTLTDSEQTIYVNIAPAEGYWTDKDHLNGVEKIASLIHAGAPMKRSPSYSGLGTIAEVEGENYAANGAGLYQVTVPALADGQTDDQIAEICLIGTIVESTDLSEATITASSATYTGVAQIASGITVTLEETELTVDTDYTVTTNAGGTNVGNYAIGITGMGHYKGTATVSDAFKITQSTLTVTANANTITYGDAPANDGVTYSGFVGTDNESVLTGTLGYTYSYTQYDNVGNEYTITPSGLISGNYNISFVTGTLTVQQKEVGLTWGNTSFTYNGSAQKPTATATGLVNSDVIGVTVTGDQTNAGTGYTATASALTGDKSGNYKLPAANTTTFSIATATLTGITVSGYNSTYDGTAHGITATAEGATIKYGTTEGEYNLDASPTYTSVGYYQVYYKITKDNYTTVTGNETVNITKAALSVTAKPKTINYGDAPANDGVTYSGFVNSETSSVLGGTLTYAYTYSQYGNVGNYTITPSGLTSGNYNISFVTGTLTVQQKEVGLTWGNTSFTYNGSAQKPTATATGLVNSDVIGVTVTGGQTGVGDYTATASALTGTKSANYKLPNKNTTSFSISPNIIEEDTDGTEVTEDENGYTVNVTETTSNTAADIIDLPEDNITVYSLTYSRTLNENDEQAYTVCLPYDPPADPNLTYYTLADCDGTTLSFLEISGTPQANTPYLVRASATTDIGQQDVHGVTMSKEVANSSSAGGYVFKGTLSGFSHSEAIGLYILQAGNRWGRVGSDTHAYIPPFRAYIEATSTARPNSLDSTLGDEATGIQQLRTVDNDGTERWFDLQGHRIAKPAKGGVYIHNGKKVVNGK